MNEPISSIMTKKVITLHPDNTLGEARDIFMSKRIHHIPIIQEGRKLVGMITSWDMFKLGMSAEKYQSMKVSEVMTRTLATLPPDQHIGAAAEVLLEHLFHAVPLVDENGNLEGIVTTTDIIRYEYRKEYPENLDKFIPENM